MSEDVKVPEGWKRVRLGEILKYEQPTKYLVKNEDYDKDIGIPVLTPGKTFILGYTEENFGVFKNIPAIIFDDFTTESKYINFPFKLKSSAVKILKTKDEKNNLFIIYNIMQILGLKPGSEHKRFWISEFSKFPILLPPLPEQQKIAEILETVDNAIEKTEKIIEKYKRIKQGLMQELLTKGIDENGRIRSEKTHKFKDSPIGRIPEEWEVVRLGEIITLEYGKGLPETKRIYGEYPVYGSNGIVGFHNKFLVKGPGIIVGRKGSMGAISWCKTHFWPIDTTYFVTLKTPTISKEWLYIKLISLDLTRLSLSDIVPGLNRKLVYLLQIPLPPLPEQQRIAEILSQIDNVIEKEEAYKQKLEQIKKGLMEDLLTGRVRVNNLLLEEENEK
ncbi:MAG: restriction endonuclease subunit S [Pseudothermotoga sp.]